VLSHLPDSAKRARASLLQLASSLEDEYPGAARSLEEGLDDLLTVLRLDVGPTLLKSIRSTNAIET